MKLAFKRILVIVVIGATVSGQQVSSQNVFQEEKDLVHNHLVITSPNFTDNMEPTFVSFHYDTVEAFEIEVEEDKGPGLYKELAVFLIVGAMVGYIVVQMIKPDDEGGEGSSNGGKNGVVPVEVFSVPFN
jgi:hypothetical protein